LKKYLVKSPFLAKSIKIKIRKNAKNLMQKTKRKSANKEKANKKAIFKRQA